MRRPAATTARGILLYRVPSGVDPTAWPTGAGPSIEIIRHAHRYAVVWPSIHPETGQPYRWYRPDGTLADEGEIPGLGDLPELPAAWLVGLTGHGGNGGHVNPGHGPAAARPTSGHESGSRAPSGRTLRVRGPAGR